MNERIHKCFLTFNPIEQDPVSLDHNTCAQNQRNEYFGCIDYIFFPSKTSPVMDMDKLTGIDQITGQNGLFPPVLPISPALLFSVLSLNSQSTMT